MCIRVPTCAVAVLLATLGLTAGAQQAATSVAVEPSTGTLPTVATPVTEAAAPAAPAATAATAAPAAPAAPAMPAAPAAADTRAAVRETPGAETQSVEQQLAGLERDLAILEEDLLYPPSSRVAVYLSMDVGALFSLDEVELKLNGTTVAHHLYTERQTDALHRGGVQRLFVGNARQGSNELTAFFLGRNQEGRELRRATTKTFTKAFEPLFLELHVADSETLQRPEFSVEVH